MKLKTGEVILVMSSIALFYFIYKRQKSNSSGTKNAKYYSDRLREMDLTDRDVSGMDINFLKKWTDRAEYFATHGGGGGLPGWEYGKKFDYNGRSYFIKGGTENNPYKD